MGENAINLACNFHSCEDCTFFKISNEESPCSNCSHGGQRDVKDVECKHVKIYNKATIEKNRRFIR